MENDFGRMVGRSAAALIVALIVLPRADAACQALSDDQLQRLRAGATRVDFLAESVSVPLVGSANTPLVEVYVNATGPYRFLVDLGSNVTLLRRNVVDAAGGTILLERATSDIVSLDAIRLGGAGFERVTAAAYDELDVDGVLGFNVLQHASFTLDFPSRRLVLHRRSLPPPDGRSVFPYRLVGRMPYVVVSLGTDTLLLNLDTGATEWMTIPPGMQSGLRWRAPPVPGRMVFNNQTGRTRILEGYLADTLRFGPLVLPSPLVYVNPDTEDAWLGVSALRGAVWTFDTRQLRVQVVVPPAAP